MLATFMTIIFFLTEISTPAWQKDVRQIAYKFLEAMNGAEKAKTDYD